MLKLLQIFNHLAIMNHILFLTPLFPGSSFVILRIDYWDDALAFFLSKICILLFIIKWDPVGVAADSRLVVIICEFWARCRVLWSWILYFWDFFIGTTNWALSNHFEQILLCMRNRTFINFVECWWVIRTFLRIQKLWEWIISGWICWRLTSFSSLRAFWQVTSDFIDNFLAQLWTLWNRAVRFLIKHADFSHGLILLDLVLFGKASLDVWASNIGADWGLDAVSKL